MRRLGAAPAALDPIVESRDSFFAVLPSDAFGGVFVTSVAGVLREGGLRVTGGAGHSRVARYQEVARVVERRRPPRPRVRGRKR